MTGAPESDRIEARRSPAPVRAYAAKWLAVEDRIFTEWRIQFYGSGVVAAYVFSFIWRFWHHCWLVLPNGRFQCVDFAWMWLSGRLIVSGQSALLFDGPSFQAAQFALLGPNNCITILPFSYPPIFLFFLAPLGLMPFAIAFAVWNLTTLACYLGSIYAIIGRRAALIAALTPFFVLVNFDYGHNGFITAGLIGFSLILIGRRPSHCGALLALLTYKPQFGLLFPIALLAARNRRAVTSAVLASLLVSLAATMAFGERAWLAWIGSVLARPSITSPDGQVELGLYSLYGLLHWAGAGTAVAWAAHCSLACTIVFAVGLTWVASLPYSLKAAMLALGSTIVTPYLLFYDLCVIAVGVAFLIEDGLNRGYRPGERTILLLCWAGLFSYKTLISAIISPVLCLLVVRRALQYRHTIQDELRRRLPGGAENMSDMPERPGITDDLRSRGNGPYRR